MTKYYFAGGLRIAGRVVVPSASASSGALLAGVRFQGVSLPPGVAVGLALVLLLLLLSPGLRGASRWRALLAPTRVVATAAFLWLALLPPGLAKAALPGNVSLWHYHYDHVGSIHSITDASGNLYRQVRYTAYGEVRGRYDGSGAIVAAEVALRHEFTGYQSEAKSGLQYAGARYYLPKLGVFASHDPVRQFPSPYAYGPGDPVNGTDPSGASFDGPPMIPVIEEAGGFRGVAYYRPAPIPPPSFFSPEPDFSRLGLDRLVVAPVHFPPVPVPAFIPGVGLSRLDKIQLGLDLASLGLDASVVGAPVSAVPDILNAGISTARGDFTGAGLSLTATIPVLGGAANAGRIARAAGKAVEGGGGARKLARKPERHHTVPKEILKNELPAHVAKHPLVRGRAGARNIWHVPYELHRQIHRGAGGGRYNEEFKAAIRALRRPPEVEDVLRIRDALVREHGLEAFRPR